MHTYVCMCVCMCMHVRVIVFVHACTCMYLHWCMYVCIYMNVRLKGLGSISPLYRNKIFFILNVFTNVRIYVFVRTCSLNILI